MNDFPHDRSIGGITGNAKPGMGVPAGGRGGTGAKNYPGTPDLRVVGGGGFPFPWPVVEADSNKRNNAPLRVGIIGMGGFAARHHEALILLEKEGESRLVATCDPNVPAFSDAMETWRFSARGVRVYSDYLGMLDACAGELDLVVVPTPIPFHAEMHRQCVERGIPVYLEKPPTLLLSELDSMIETDRRQTRRTNVGFNFMVERPRLDLKERLLAGEFGPLRRVAYQGLAPRPASYFQRNNWAGRLLVKDRPVLDSCMGNAMAHYVHNTLFWAGTTGIHSWATVDSVRAEIYRANPIENADLFFVHADLPDGVGIDLCITHACQTVHQEEVLDLEKARIRYRTNHGCSVEWRDGRKDETRFDRHNLLPDNHRYFYRYLRGERDRPVTSLEDSRSFVQLYNLAYASSGGITTVPAEHLLEWEKGEDTFTAVKAIAPVFGHFVETGEFPASRGLPWARPAIQTARPGDEAGLEKRVCEWAARDPA